MSQEEGSEETNKKRAGFRKHYGWTKGSQVSEIILWSSGCQLKICRIRHIYDIFYDTMVTTYVATSNNTALRPGLSHTWYHHHYLFPKIIFNFLIMNHPKRRSDNDPKIRSSGDSTSSNQAKTENDTDVPFPPPQDPSLPEDSPALALLLDELRLIAVAGHYNVRGAVNIEKARNILEATAGDVLTAAQLYWDDYLATLQQEQHDPEPVRPFAPPLFAEPAFRNDEYRFEPLMDEFVGVRPPDAAVPPRLADPLAIAEQSDDDQDMGDPSRGPNPRESHLPVVRGASSKPSSNEAHNFVQVLSKFEETMRKRDADQLSNNNNDDDVGIYHRMNHPWVHGYGDEGASVSDDEKVFIHRRNSHQYTSHRRLLQHLARTCDPETVSMKRRKLNPSDTEGEDSKHNQADDDEYLSDSDWMWESLATTSSSVERSLVSPPTDILWGSAVVHDVAFPGAELEKEVMIVSGTENQVPDMPVGQSNELKFDIASAPSVMVAADDAVSAGYDTIDGPNNLTVSNPIGIPRTWMNAGFHLVSTSTTPSTKVMGLALKAPNEDDLAYAIWKQDLADTNARHPTIPLPYHCRGITALLSIVTGLLYAGVTVQGVGQITCHSAREPLQDLMTNESTAQEVKASKKKLTKGEAMYQQLIALEQSNREYDARLADALTALLYVAAEASRQRKQNALRDLQSSNDPADQRKWQKIQRKLQLVPTCSWDGIPSISDIFQESDFCNIPIATSYTNIEDLRAHVLSNLRSFTSSGGCALFLETIIRIHGKGAVAHMMQQARKKAGFTGKELSLPLIQCTCRARHFVKLDSDPVFCQTLKAQSKKGIILDTTPTGHNCVSIELLSLLLVGRVHSTWQGWYPAPLGIGILANAPGKMGRCLARPEKPVWILHGPTCYSVLWLNGCHEHEETFSRVDRPGAVATMTHWNTWYGERNATQMRLVTDRSQTIDSLLNDEDAEFERELERLTSPVLREMAKRRRAHALRASDISKLEAGNLDLLELNEELDRVLVHPDDPKFYPNNYHLWRFDLGEDPKALASDDRKQRGQFWKSYNKLSEREKLLVEAKLGPQICTLLWTRWPRATVDCFVPGGAEHPPPVV
jgi:hypothetical protein